MTARRRSKNATNTAARKAALRPGQPSSAPRVRRTLTRVQKLREHILLELGVEKQDIARAIGTTVQTVSNIFLDINRSPTFEPKIVEYLRAKYIEGSDIESVQTIDALIGRTFDWKAIGGSSITRETMGWSEPVADGINRMMDKLARQTART